MALSSGIKFRCYPTEEQKKILLKKKHHLGQELAEVTHGEKEIRRSVGTAYGTPPSLNRETPTTSAAAI
jgi:hypothetical protein